MPLNIYTSNRMENLVEELAASLTKPLASPFTPERIVVQSKGMQRWLAMELAGKLGIWANCEYPFPNKLVWQLFCRTLPNIPDISLFSPEVMTWRIMGLLPRFLDRGEFAPLNHYLAGDVDGLKRLQLAGKIADTYDQYTLFRPDMLLEWEAGRGGEWQELLWRELASLGSGQHRGRLKLEFTRQLAQLQPSETSLPERITVFGISYLPNYHMDILGEVACYTEVNLFLLSPCREYWGDIVSAQGKARRAPEERDYLVEGNPLLASLGKLARDFSNMVLTSCTTAAAEVDRYEDPGAELLLAAIQSDILNLRGAEEGRGLRMIAPDDRSVQIHSCHSPMREIEILHDNLLALLDSEEGLSPRDIVVMTPDIETYAPFISMVFEGCRDPARKIPYSIADRNLANEGQVAGLLLQLLELPGSRLTVTSVFDILESVPVSRRFGLAAQELATIRGWLEQTRIRWGVDEKHRVSLGLPGYRENSWCAGLDRLLLGYAMPVEGEQLFHGILPFDEMEGAGAQTLGKFVEFVRSVVQLAASMADPRTLGEWRETIRNLLADFVETDDESAHELAAVAVLVEALGELEEKAGFSEVVERTLIQSWLASRLAQEEKAVGFMTGGVTFCAMLPMRSIPFRVVALVGMSDNAFPRQNRPAEFDLIARNPRAGDRSLRDEDRYLFLECLLSARQYLYISYVGQSVKDNSVIPPSVLVSEFLDAVTSGFAADGVRLEERLVTRHRLQAFSRDYFNSRSNLFSYSSENCTALIEADRSPGHQAVFIATPLKEPPGEMKEITLSQLVRFFSNPAQYLLENRLKIRLAALSAPLEDREPFTVAGLDVYSLNQELVGILLQGGSVADFAASARCRGILPPAHHGDAVFAESVAEANKLAAQILALTSGFASLEPFDFAQTRREFKLSGRLDGIRADRKISYRCAKLKAKDEIRTWIEHLALNAFAPDAYPRESLLIMSDRSVTFGPVENAADILDAMLHFYWQGLMAPLRFFPATSLEFVMSGGIREKARKKWESGFKYMGEAEDPYFRLCFGQGEDPLTDEFEELAQVLLGDLVRHRR
jgi:exodeoxyribonuclease V gamma subunit